MANRPLQYATIFLTCFIDILGFGIVIPVLPLYAERFGATPFEVGCLVGIFSLAQFFFAPVWGKVSDRVGRKPILVLGLIGTIAGYLLMATAESVTVLFAARLLAGIAGANISAAQAYLADISKPEERARAMGILGAAFGLGFVFGPALGGWAGVAFNYAAPMYFAAALALLNLLFVGIALPESLDRERRGRRSEPLFPNLFSHVRLRPYLWSLASYFLVIMGFSMMTAIFALLLLHRFGLDALHTGYVLAGVGLLGVLVQGGLIGRLVRWFGEPSLALTGAALMSAGLALLAFSRTVNWMIAATAAIGIGNSLLMPTLSALASRSAEADWQGRALGILQSSGSLARWTGPLCAGVLLGAQISDGGPYAFWPLIAAAAVLAGAAIPVCGLAVALRSPAAVRSSLRKGLPENP